MGLTKISTGGVKDDAASQAKIADEAIDEARLQISNAGTNGQFLQKSSGTGGLTWATVDTNLSSDTSPQLGGDFDSNNHNIEFKDRNGSDDANVLNFGDDDDMRFYSDGNHGFIQGDNLNIGTASNNANTTVTNTKWECKIDFDISNSKKLGIGGSYGTSGQVLTSGGANAAPSWSNPAAGGNTVEIQADGAISAGKPVIIKSNGKAREVQTEATPVDRLVRNNGSEQNISADDFYLERSKKNCVAYDPGSDTCLVIMRTSGASSNDNRVNLKLFQTNPSDADSLTMEFNGWTTGANEANDGRIACCALSGSRYFIMYYRSSGGSGSGVYCKIITITSGPTLSQGSEYFIGGAQGASNVDYMSATETTTNRVCILVRSKDNSKPALIIGDITSNNVWNCRRNEDISTNSIDNPYENELYYDATDGVLCGIYQTAGANIRLVGMKVAAGTSATLTVGAIQTLNSATSDKNSLAFHSASGNWVTAYRNNTGNKDTHYQVHSINSSTLAITSGTAITRSSANAQYGIALSVTAEDRIVATYVDSGQIMRSEIFTVSGTSITSQGAPQGILSSIQDIDRHGSVYMTHNSMIAAFCTRGSNGMSMGTADTTAIASNINSIGNNVLGFAPSAINDGATGTINLPGNTVDNQSSLTAGTRYYIQDNGTLSPNFVTTRGGVLALSATKGVVYGHDT